MKVYVLVESDRTIPVAVLASQKCDHLLPSDAVAKPFSSAASKWLNVVSGWASPIHGTLFYLLEYDVLE